MTKSLLVLGATSAIAKATANCYASQGYDLFLAGRDSEELLRLASDFSIRYGVNVKTGFFDAFQLDEHEAFVHNAIEEMNGLQGVLLAFGELGDHSKATVDFSESKKIFDSNFIGACSVLHYLANYFIKKKEGFIIGISSVAGDRGRQSNYIYGAAKGGFSLYLQGLRNRLYPHNVTVATVEPGMVDTAMTYGLKGLVFVASPKEVGKKIFKKVEKGKDIIYVPWFWRYIMLVIKCIPEKIFKRLKL